MSKVRNGRRATEVSGITPDPSLISSDADPPLQQFPSHRVTDAHHTHRPTPTPTPHGRRARRTTCKQAKDSRTRRCCRMRKSRAAACCEVSRSPSRALRRSCTLSSKVLIIACLWPRSAGLQNTRTWEWLGGKGQDAGIRTQDSGPRTGPTGLIISSQTQQ